jgi:hypothetical protein
MSTLVLTGQRFRSQDRVICAYPGPQPNIQAERVVEKMQSQYMLDAQFPGIQTGLLAMAQVYQRAARVPLPRASDPRYYLKDM